VPMVVLMLMMMVVMVMLPRGLRLAGAAGELVHQLDELIRRSVMVPGQVAGLQALSSSGPCPSWGRNPLRTACDSTVRNSSGRVAIHTLTAACNPCTYLSGRSFSMTRCRRYSPAFSTSRLIKGRVLWGPHRCCDCTPACRTLSARSCETVVGRISSIDQGRARSTGCGRPTRTAA
jgi:hypothetical protein